MAFSKKPSAIIYIDRLKCVFYSNINRLALNLSFSSETVRDMEIVSKEKLHTLIKSFIETQKIPQSEVIFVLAQSLVFEKELQEVAPDQEEFEVQNFLDITPFQNIYWKRVKLYKKTKLYVTNKDFCDTFRNILRQLGFIVEGIVPVALLQEAIPQLRTNLDLHIMLEKFDAIKQYSIVDLIKTPLSSDLKEENSKEKSRFGNKRMLFLLGTLGLLLLILFMLLFTQSQSPPPQNKGNEKKVIQITVFPTPTQIPTPEVTIPATSSGLLVTPATSSGRNIQITPTPKIR